MIGAESKNFISCPHVWTLPWSKNPDTYKAGDLFLVTDHANISASSPGIGPNIDEYGPRFYDITTMYEKRLTEALKTSLAGSHHCEGDVFWVNNSTIPSVVHTNMAEGLSNERVCFKGVIKAGISELMAVQHRQSLSQYRLSSGMLGIVSDAVVRKQHKSEDYIAGVKHLFQTAWSAFP